MAARSMKHCAWPPVTPSESTRSMTRLSSSGVMAEPHGCPLANSLRRPSARPPRRGRAPPSAHTDRLRVRLSNLVPRFPRRRPVIGLQRRRASRLLRREPQNREIAEGRNRTFLKPPRSHVAALGRSLALCRSTVRYPTVEDHLHPSHGRERLLQVLVERRVVFVHNDEQFGIGKRSRRQRLQELGLVVGAYTVRRLGVVERLALTHVAGQAFAATPGT